MAGKLVKRTKWKSELMKFIKSYIYFYHSLVYIHCEPLSIKCLLHSRFHYQIAILLSRHEPEITFLPAYMFASGHTGIRMVEKFR